MFVEKDLLPFYDVCLSLHSLVCLSVVFQELSSEWSLRQKDRSLLLLERSELRAQHFL